MPYIAPCYGRVESLSCMIAKTTSALDFALRSHDDSPVIRVRILPTAGVESNVDAVFAGGNHSRQEVGRVLTQLAMCHSQ